MSHDEAVRMEIDLIEKFKTNNSEYGYNLTKGGDGVNGKVVSEKTK